MSLPATSNLRLDLPPNPCGSVVTLREASVLHGRGDRAVHALSEVSGRVPSGASLAVVGQSGSGKSTLVHVMAGLQELTSGSVEWPSLGGHPRDRPGVVGVVFQAPSLLPPLDVLENVALPLLLRGVRPAEANELARDALELVELGTVAHQLPEELSGGQAQRVAIARALVTRPVIILADEPTGQLDHETAARVLDLMIEQVEAVGSSLVVSTHDTAVADRFPLRWRMSDGRLEIEATS